ncbi:MAG: tRNA (adenine(22)-N(1))-methyltransferase [Bilifractor sp.]|jgi:tRNA (adenine22-N1)-methyltransferase
MTERTDEIRLSDRLTAVAEMLRIGKRPADIGCDHAYVPIRLCETGKIRSAIAADVRKGPLEIAADHIARHGLADRIETRLSDGFRNIRKGEADSALIAGMGGMLICRILTEGRDILPTLRELVLEPQSDVDRVRSLLTEGRDLSCRFRIDDEKMICEGGKYYPVIHAVPVTETSGATGAESGCGGEPAGNFPLSPEQLLYGPVMLEKRDPVLRSYLEKRQKTLREIESSLVYASGYGTERTGKRLAEIRGEIACCERALGYYEGQETLP